jgi:hypothetical protein
VKEHVQKSKRVVTSQKNILVGLSTEIFHEKVLVEKKTNQSKRRNIYLNNMTMIKSISGRLKYLERKKDSLSFNQALGMLYIAVTVAY